MWLRLRLDIGWRDLAWGLAGTRAPGARITAQQQLETFWSDGRNDVLACLSVRSGFDLLLQALDLPHGSEVLFSALNIPDMPVIAARHGLVPVPVDLDDNFRMDASQLQKRLTSRSRLVVVAHLFGSRPDIGAIGQVARAHDLLVVEDCAQAWFDRDWRGNDCADASLFSFGAIKTATALGGALCRISDAALLSRMRDIQASQAVRPHSIAIWKRLKFAALKAVSSRIIFSACVRIGRVFGLGVDKLLSGLTRGFPRPDLLAQIRQQPDGATLSLLLHRLKTYDFNRIQRRVENARRIIARLGLQSAQPGLIEIPHSFWLFPLVASGAHHLRQPLRAHGFDTARRGSLAVLDPPPGGKHPPCQVAHGLLRQTLFLPCYCEMPIAEIDRMCSIIRQQGRGN